MNSLPRQLFLIKDAHVADLELGAEAGRKWLAVH